MERRTLLKYLGSSALVGTVSVPVLRCFASGREPTSIKLVAQRFRFAPDEINLRSGTTTILEITSLDFVHGFKVPDLGIRIDLFPGRVTPVVIKPLAPGRYPFLCDNFCGAGHEDMNGTINVT